MRDIKFFRFLAFYTVFFITSPLFSITALEEQRVLWKKEVENIPDYPEDKFSGRGVVIPAGGFGYLVNAWVSVCMLRESGCKLPVEIWYLGDIEYIPPLMEELESLGAMCKDITPYFDYPIKGWEIKVHAIIASSFQEVLFLDADCLVLHNPEYLFEEKEYLESGALFWPDNQTIEKINPLLDLLEIPFENYLAQESGQILIDKKKSWGPLQLCRYMNRNSHFYYTYIYGDKDTFHLSWKALGSKYCMIRYTPYDVCKWDLFYDNHFTTPIFCYVHRNLQGNPLFLHSCGLKWHWRTSEDLVFNFYNQTNAILNEINPDFSSEKKVYLFRDIFPNLESQCLESVRKIKKILDHYYRRTPLLMIDKI